MIGSMSPALMLSFLVVGLLALLPVWRLRIAGWPPRWLFAAWVIITVMGLLVVRLPGPARFLLPMLVLAYVAPFVAGPERVTRVLGGEPPVRGGGVIIDVTPRLGIRPPDEDRVETPDDDPPTGA